MRVVFDYSASTKFLYWPSVIVYIATTTTKSTTRNQQRIQSN